MTLDLKPRVPGKLILGLKLNYVNDVRKIKKQIEKTKYDFFCFNVLENCLEETYLSLDPAEIRRKPFSWAEIVLSSAEWTKAVVGVAGDFQSHLDVNNDMARKRAEILFLKQLDYTCYTHMMSTIINLHPDVDFYGLARSISARLGTSYRFVANKFWIKVKLNKESGEKCYDKSDGLQEIESWSLWNEFRTLCEYSGQLGVVIELPTSIDTDLDVARWIGEPVEAVIVTSGTFITVNGFMDLPARHKQVIKQLFEIGARVIVEVNTINQKPKLNCILAVENMHELYSEFFLNLHQTWLEDISDSKSIAMKESYIHPTICSLDYEVSCSSQESFEKEVVKYELYRKAIHEALVSKIRKVDEIQSTLVVIVTGAGRGPLVEACIAASESSGQKIKVYAVEGNLNLVNTLYHKVQRWETDVTIVNEEIEDWSPAEMADIVVAEFLGSFGCNELSTEGIGRNSVQGFLKEDGIMIPQSCKTFLRPFMSSRIFELVRHRNEQHKLNYEFEEPFIAQGSKYYIAEPKVLYYFTLPEREQSQLFQELNFKINKNCLLHGFEEYYELCLFGKILLSNHPASKITGLSSSSLIFPLREPVPLKVKDDLVVQFYRCCTKDSVWYEWTIIEPTIMPFHNPSGRTHKIQK